MSHGIRQLLRSLTKINGSSSGDLLQPLRLSIVAQRSVHVTCSLSKEIRKGQDKIRVGNADELQMVDVASESIGGSTGLFPDQHTLQQTFDGIPYAQLPIVNIKSTKNNTILNMTSPTGLSMLLHSAGIEGFKTCRKGTGTAAQQAAITFATRARKLGVKNVRVRVQGFGLGRMSGVTGLSMAGMKIVSITDTTRVSPNPPRPRGPKSL